MNDSLSLLGVALVILALCFGISSCKYTMAQADAINVQNEIARKQHELKTKP